MTLLLSAGKWTPGPWRATFGDLVRIRSYKSPVIVAGVHRPGMRTGNPNDVECYANAHLIAAAPDLYEVVAAALDEYETHNGRKTSASDPHWSVSARAALAKARGEVRRVAYT